MQLHAQLLRLNIYGVMALTTCEVVWLTPLLRELGLELPKPVSLKCNNQAVLSIV